MSKLTVIAGIATNCSLKHNLSANLNHKLSAPQALPGRGILVFSEGAAVRVVYALVDNGIVIPITDGPIKSQALANKLLKGRAAFKFTGALPMI